MKLQCTTCPHSIDTNSPKMPAEMVKAILAGESMYCGECLRKLGKAKGIHIEGIPFHHLNHTLLGSNPMVKV